MDNLELAKKLKAEAEEKARKLDEYIAVRSKVNELESELFNTNEKTYVTDTSSVKDEISLSSNQKQPMKYGSFREEVASKAKTYIEDAGTALHTRQLVDLLEKDGVQISAKNKIVAVSQALGISDKFKANRKTGWELVSKDEATGTVNTSGFDLTNQ